MPKWRSVDELIEKRIALSRLLLTRALAKGVRRLDQKMNQEDETAWRTESGRMREAILDLFEAGELDKEQYEFLLRIMPRGATHERRGTK